VLWLAGSLWAQQTHQPPAPVSPCADAALWQTLLSELRGLRIELLRERFERTRSRIADLERQLAKAETDRTQADSIERSRVAELAELQERLAGPVTAEERSELEQYRSQIINAGALRIAEAGATNARLESALREQFQHEQQVGRELREQLRALGADSPRD
jgi:hypothetical protein